MSFCRFLFVLWVWVSLQTSLLCLMRELTEVGSVTTDMRHTRHVFYFFPSFSSFCAFFAHFRFVATIRTHVERFSVSRIQDFFLKMHWQNIFFTVQGLHTLTTLSHEPLPLAVQCWMTGFYFNLLQSSRSAEMFFKMLQLDNRMHFPKRLPKSVD